MTYVVIACAGTGAFKLIGTYSTLKLARDSAEKALNEAYTGYEDVEIHETKTDSGEVTFIEYFKR